jgi:hypothetical protein
VSTESICILFSEYNKWQGAYEEKDWPTETCNSAGFRQLALLTTLALYFLEPLPLLALFSDPEDANCLPAFRLF